MKQPPFFRQNTVEGMDSETGPLGPRSINIPTRVVYAEIQELAGTDFTANITSGSNQVTITLGSANTADFAIGYSIVATGVPAGTIIAKIDGPIQFTLSANATATTNGVSMRANIVGARGTQFNGNITSGSAVVTAITMNTADMTVGHFVSGVGIPLATKINSIDSPTQITLSANATATIVGNPMRTGVEYGGAAAYCWQEINFQDGGAFGVNIYGLASGGVCDPLDTQGQTGYAWELNGDDTLTAGTIVKLEPTGTRDEAGESWRIITASGGGVDGMQFVKVTSTSASGGKYPAALVIQPITAGGTYTTGEVVWYFSAIGTVPTLDSYHLCKRVDVISGVKVYSDADIAGGTELKGLTFTSDTASQADTDPGAGKFRWNNATQSSATVLYFDNSTTDAIAINTLWSSLQAMGYIFLQQGDDSTKWQLWKRLVKPTDGTGYYKFPVTLIASGGSIADAKTVYCEFIGVPKCREYTYGTAITTGDVTLSAEWGPGATVSAVLGNDEVGTIQVLTDAADTPSANPILTLTFKDGTWPGVPHAVACMAPSGSSPIAIVTTNTTATTMSLTYNGTPTATVPYNYNFVYHVRYADS